MKRILKFTNRELFKVQTDLIGRDFKADYLKINDTGTIFIPNGYSWDGCTPKIAVADLMFGTPDGTICEEGVPYAFYPSMVHDALYQYKATVPVTRKEADKLFYQMLKERNFYWAKVYYVAVRLFGGLCGKWGKK